MGSSCFFNKFEDYVKKDDDEMHIMDSFALLKTSTNVLNMKQEGKDVFFYRNISKEEHIKDILESGVNMRAGKFLVPEIVEYFHFTIDDLKQLESCFNNMDEKHKYEKIIYDSYIENQDFKLTDEQLLKAYNEYKRERPDVYEKG